MIIEVTSTMLYIGSGALITTVFGVSLLKKMHRVLRGWQHEDVDWISTDEVRVRGRRYIRDSRSYNRCPSWYDLKTGQLLSDRKTEQLNFWSRLRRVEPKAVYKEECRGLMRDHH
jgi:hypothetical protein